MHKDELGGHGDRDWERTSPPSPDEFTDGRAAARKVMIRPPA
ncbi:hypothetical protein [Kribbella yunnanensis]